ncbi:HAMP domain-containing sensor histidine kinase [Paracoccus aestuariivivens]|uniref:histidine kinase n=1 Tax=Paracoccus aestuariivivens TaxID=1820333 RepID=A0A6L6JHT5_9RHOB|nr:ATP-binding protein [Paracoccus aestuariivivens]MTH80117.1 HAMP domain-containing protein [Paracoccus aestuariivivens]
MRQMVLRFFWYIWGAIIGTSLLLLVLTVRLDLPPPGHVPIETVRQLVQATANIGSNSTDIATTIAESPALNGHVIVANGAACDGPGLVLHLTDTRCILTRPPLAQLGGLERFLPILTPLTIGILVSLICALLLARRFVRPIRRIGAGLTALSQGDLDRRIGQDLHRSEPEIADVGRAFDTAAEKLQELTESRSRLFHDISHEIRSPLARLQAQTALLRRNPARLPAMLDRMDGDIGRIDQLVDEVLTLARMERGTAQTTQRVEIDLLDILDPIIRDAEFEGQARGIRLEYSGPHNLPMAADPELLHRAIENIIRNALRYAPEGATVELRLVTHRSSAELTISDRGPGVAPDQITSIFHAFVRDESRDGIGLGLAIAANVIRLHGGTITARNRDGGGLTVTCVLPLSHGGFDEGIV